ncbi:MAG: SRPBCC family protein [Methylocystis sp.]
MRETVVIEKNIAVGADRAWAAIRAIGGLDRWFPIISGCRVEGEGVGAVRVLALKASGEMRDRIVEIVDEAKRLRYERTHHPFPVADYRGLVEIRGDGDARSVLTWTIQFTVEPNARDAMAELVGSAISDGIDGLERELR